MQIISYPHPTLLRPSKPLRRVDAELHQIIRQMFELMYAHKGVGLAANQVDLPVRLFVMNVEGDPAQSREERVFINPVISLPKGSVEDEEGCLSLPGLNAPVRRPERVTITGYDLTGNAVRMPVEGLFARIVQHETDHLDGKLFIDRLSETNRLAIKEELEEFEIEFRSQRSRGEIPDDQQIQARWAELEKRWT